MKRFFLSRRILAAIAVGSIATLTPLIAHGIGEGVISNFLFAPILSTLLFIVYSPLIVLGGVVSLEAWLLQVFIHINTKVISSATVGAGYPAMLNIANLAFVIAIVVIAIATIVRSQSYGIKQALWKLIVMAVMVNFGLAISGAILGFADGLTHYFLNNVSNSPISGPVDAYTTFIDQTIAAVKPQIAIIAGKPSDPSDAALAVAAKETFDGVGADLGKGLRLLALIVGSFFFMFAIIVTLGVLAIMLLIRYIYLGFLLIVLPVAWAAWVFPTTSNLWHKWWDKFIKQTAFLPIVMFFIALSINLQSSLSETLDSQLFIGPQNGAWAAVNNFFQDLFSPTIITMLEQTVVLATMLGGMMMAHSMGIHFAGAATATVTNAGKAFGGYVGQYTRRKGVQAGTAAFRSQTGKKVQGAFSGLSQVGANQGRILRTLTAPVRAVGGYTARGMEAVKAQGSDKAIADAKNRWKNTTVEQKMAAMSTVDAPTRIALLEEIEKAGRINDVKNIKRYIGGESTKDEFARYGSEKLYKTLRGSSGLHLKELLEEQDNIIAGKVKRKDEKGNELDKVKSLEENKKAIFKHFNSAPGPGQLADYFENYEDAKAKGKVLLDLDPDEYGKMQIAIAKGTAGGFSPTVMSEFFKKLSRSDQLDNFKKVAEKANITYGDGYGMINERSANWLRGNGARNLGVNTMTFNLPEQSKGGDAKKAPPATPPPGPTIYNASGRPVTSTTEESPADDDSGEEEVAEESEPETT